MPGEQQAGWREQGICNCTKAEPCERCAVKERLAREVEDLLNGRRLLYPIYKEGKADG